MKPPRAGAPARLLTASEYASPRHEPGPARCDAPGEFRPERFPTGTAKRSASSRIWTVHAAVRNVFGTRYATFGTFNLHQDAGGALERFLTPGQPRTVHVGVTRRLGR